MRKTKKPRKQRKRIYQAPLHRRHKLISAHLSQELRKKFNRRSIPIRKGDKVKIMRGEFKGMTGAIKRVDLKRYKVYIDGVTRKKADGSKAEVPIHASNLLILSLETADRMRRKVLERTKEEKGEAKKTRST